MGRYCKLPPSAVEKININGTPLSKKAPKHPDGWFLCLPAHCVSLWDRDKYDNFEDAIIAAGGIMLDEQQAFESQRGDLVGRGDENKIDYSITSGNDESQPETSSTEDDQDDQEESETENSEDPGEGEEGDEK